MNGARFNSIVEFFLGQKTFPGENMLKILSYCLKGMVMLSVVFWSCSDKKEPRPEKGAIQKMTEETAKEAAQQIRTPIEKARSVAKQQEDKNKELDDAVKKQ